MADGGQHLRSAQAVEFQDRRMLRQLLQMTPDAITGAMNIAVEGEWLGHEKGPLKFDAASMDQLISRFELQRNPMMVDYDHLTVRGRMRPGDGQAAGWIQRLYRKDGPEGAELWADVEWTEDAAKMIKAGKYRYCSPVIDPIATDRKTGDDDVGAELFNVALTNSPFLDGQHPIQLSRIAADNSKELPVSDEEKPKPQPQPQLEIELKPNAAEGEGEGKTDVAAAPDDKDKEPPKASPFEAAAEEPPAPPANPEETAVSQLASFVESVMTASGGSKAAVLDALNTLSDEIGGMVRNRLETTDGSASDAQEIPMSNESKGGDREILMALAKQIGDMTADRAEEKREAAAQKIKDDAANATALERQNDARVTAMLGDGRLAESERETARLTLSRDPELFEAFYGKRVAGSASPVGRRQADDVSHDAGTAGGDADNDLALGLAKLSGPERKTFDAFVQMGKEPKATLRRMLSAQARDGVRILASRVGIEFPN